MSLGFGPLGVITGEAPRSNSGFYRPSHALDIGTIAAAFQSIMYGGFTPAGGLFATLTSMAMVGTLMPAVFVFSSLVASLVAAMVWVYGVGR